MNVPIFAIARDRHFRSIPCKGERSACQRQSLCSDPKLTNG